MWVVLDTALHIVANTEAGSIAAQGRGLKSTSRVSMNHASVRLTKPSPASASGAGILSAQGAPEGTSAEPGSCTVQCVAGVSLKNSASRFPACMQRHCNPSSHFEELHLHRALGDKLPTRMQGTFAITHVLRSCGIWIPCLCWLGISFREGGTAGRAANEMQDQKSAPERRTGVVSGMLPLNVHSSNRTKGKPS